MSKKTIVKLLSVLLCLAFICSLCGCGADYNKNATVYADFEDFPVTLDPQLATTESEQIIVHNLFEGLMRYNKKGKLKCGAAESYDYNKDTLTYTFNIKKGLLWSNGDKLTANDFVFGFKRALNPETAAPFAKDLYAVKGAKEALAGTADFSAVKIDAADDYTLVITLAEIDKSFLSTLTKPVCMPCNENCFNKAAGQYGLNKDCLVFNGSYRIKLWDADNKTVRLGRNPKYKGKYPACNAGVTITDSETDNLTLLENKKADTVIIKYGEYEKAGELYNRSSHQNTVWYLMLNANAKNTSNKLVRQSLLQSVDRPSFEEMLKENSLTVKRNMLPKILSEQIKKELTSAAIKYDEEMAAASFSKANVTAPVTDMKLLYIDSNGMKELATALAATWQEKLGAVVNTESVPDVKALEKRVSAGKYQLAIVPVSCDTRKIKDYMRKFCEGNIYGFHRSEYDMMVNNLDIQTKSNFYRRNILNAQAALFADYTIFPIAGSRSGIASGSEIISHNYRIVPGRIDFAFFKKS